MSNKDLHPLLEWEDTPRDFISFLRKIKRKQIKIFRHVSFKKKVHVIVLQMTEKGVQYQCDPIELTFNTKNRRLQLEFLLDRFVEDVMEQAHKERTKFK